MKWVFLSYTLDSGLTGYGKGIPFQGSNLKSIRHGDSCNTTQLEFNSHFGTHIDFPYHFNDLGKKGEEFSPEHFLFRHIEIVDIPLANTKDKIISPSDLSSQIDSADAKVDFIIFKTHFCKIRDKQAYWNSNPGLDPETALFLRDRRPRLRAIGLDSISLSNWNNRELGRTAHRRFLLDCGILIVEDMNLMEIDVSSRIQFLIIAPLRYSGSDGTPVTVFAKLAS